MNPNYPNSRFRAGQPPNGWPKEFSIISAHNPNGNVQTEELNSQANARLAAELDRRGLWRWLVTGGSPGFMHAEEGYAVITNLATALAIGRAFAQDAILGIEEDAL